MLHVTIYVVAQNLVGSKAYCVLGERAVLIRLLLQSPVLTNYCTCHISHPVIDLPATLFHKEANAWNKIFMSVDKASPERPFVHGIKPRNSSLTLKKLSMNLKAIAICSTLEQSVASSAKTVKIFHL